MIELYHSSYTEIEKIDLSKSKIGKDFGVGFYLSADLAQAQKQARNVSFRMNVEKPVVSTFLFDEVLLSSDELRVKTFDNYSVEWAEFIYKNRSNRSRENVHNFDIIYGPIADDAVGVQIRRYMEKYIDIEQLVKELKFVHRVTYQYMFATNRAINTLKKI